MAGKSQKKTVSDENWASKRIDSHKCNECHYWQELTTGQYCLALPMVAKRYASSLACIHFHKKAQ